MTALNQSTSTNGSESCNAMGVGLRNIRLNQLGAVAFDCRFPGMREQEEFVVAALPSGDHESVTIRGVNHIGSVTKDGRVFLTPSIQGGAFQRHLPMARLVSALSAKDRCVLKAYVSTSSPKPVPRLQSTAKACAVASMAKA